MTIQQLHHVSVVVDDLDAAIAFFAELGMELEGQGRVEGAWVDRVNALDGVRADIAMMRSPDDRGRLELTRFLSPTVRRAEPEDALGNTSGLRSVMFVVDDIDATVARLRPHGGELIGTVEEYQPGHHICYLRGPAGIIVSLAQNP